MYMRACPAHHLSDAAPLAVPAKKKTLFFIYRARQSDHLAHFAASDHPAKIKQVKRCFFFVVALGPASGCDVTIMLSPNLVVNSHDLHLRYTVLKTLWLQVCLLL